MVRIDLVVGEPRSRQPAAMPADATPRQASRADSSEPEQASRTNSAPGAGSNITQAAGEDSSDFDDFDDPFDDDALPPQANPPTPQPITVIPSDSEDNYEALEPSSPILALSDRENEGDRASENGGDTSEDEDIPNPPDDI